MSEGLLELFHPAPEMKPFWDGCKEGVLRLPRCASCRGWFLPAAMHCPWCLAPTVEWATASGRGRVYSWVVYHRPFHPALADRVPYNVAIVELDEGVRLITNLVEATSIRVGQRVQVRFTELARDLWVPQFVPVSPAG